ncbi:MAG: DNA polymerase I [Clostridia bacterium]|nr:DNA polymerase I [Clostridia bacterium]
MEKLLVLDGNSILNRAFYGIRNLSNSAGLPTNAVFGFLNMIKKHLDALHPDYLVCAFDVKAKTFRHEAYDAYKGTRKGMPEELAMQLPYAKKAAAALGFKVIECPGYEADDILGTLSRMSDETEHIHCYLLTGDRDSLQLITDRTSVILTKTKEDIVYTPSLFTEEYGVVPPRLVDVKALMGDSSDNIPGVAGIGEKTAFKLIQTAGSLDNLYASEDYFGAAAGVCKKLTDGKEAAYLSYRLAEICTSAPLGITIADLAENTADENAFLELCSELEFHGMAKKFGFHADESPKNRQEEERFAITETDAIPSLPDDVIPAVVWMDELAVCDGKTVYVCHTPSTEMAASVLAGPFVCHDLKQLLQKINDCTYGEKCRYDTMLASYLLEPGKGSYPLNKAADLHNISLPENPSAAQCAGAVWQLWKTTVPLIEEQDMLPLLTDLEIPLAAVLADMENIGFKVDPDGILRYAGQLQEAENALAARIWLEAGHDFNINSPKQLGEVLFEELNLPAGRKTKTGYSTDAETLEKLRPYHPIVEDILSYRQIAKLRGTYGESLAKLADENGRIHTKLNQTGTATGRLSSNDPNLQNIPIRMELGRELRKYFITENEEYVLIDADYSQIELRLLAHLADDAVMQEAFISGRDIHTKVASQVFGVSEEEVTPELRRRAKAVNFGIIYGIGDYSLSQDLHITRKQAGQYIADYLSTYPDVDIYLQNTIADAKKNGFTTTLYGRRRPIPELAAKNKVQQAFGERVAMNSPIQGTAADVIKIAMLRVHNALKEAGIDARLIMQVHDELIVESAKSCAEEAKAILIREMENAVSLSVPLAVEAGMGENWYAVK